MDIHSIGYSKTTTVNQLLLVVSIPTKVVVRKNRNDSEFKNGTVKIKVL